MAGVLSGRLRRYPDRFEIEILSAAADGTEHTAMTIAADRHIRQSVSTDDLPDGRTLITRYYRGANAICEQASRDYYRALIDCYRSEGFHIDEQKMEGITTDRCWMKRGE